MTKNFLRFTLILVVCALNSCTKSDRVGCWKCTIKKAGSEKTRTVCDKTLQEAHDLVFSEEIGSWPTSVEKINCKED